MFINIGKTDKTNLEKKAKHGIKCITKPQIKGNYVTKCNETMIWLNEVNTILFSTILFLLIIIYDSKLNNEH